MGHSLFARLARGTGTALAIHIISAGVIYASQVWLARWMGSTEYGIYDYVTTVGLVGAFMAGLGLPAAVLRFVSAYQIQEDWPHLWGIILGSWRQTLVIGLVASGCSTVIVWATAQTLGNYARPLLVGIWAIPVLALVGLQREIIRAFQQLVLAYAPSLIMQPLALVGMATVWQMHRQLTSTVAIALSLLSALLALALQWLIFQQTLDVKIRQARPAYELARWWKAALPLLLFSGSHLVLSQTDTLMIGAALGAKQVGLYGAALKTSAWVPFILMAVNAIAAPLIAALYAQGDRQGLQQLVSIAARWMFYPALATGIGLAVLAEPILQLFGPGFVAAKGTLIILILGQLVNVGAGSVGYLMIMTGHQNETLVVMATSALVNVSLNFMGIHFLGIAGAALATAFSMAMWNIRLYGLVVRRLGVRPSILDAYRTSGSR